MIEKSSSLFSISSKFIPFEHGLIFKVSFCDKVWLSVSRIDKLLVVMIVAGTSLQL